MSEATVAISLAMKRLIGSLVMYGARVLVLTQIIIGWITQSPIIVIIRNNANCFFALPLLCLNVNDLFAKKLNMSEIPVEK